MTKQKTYSAYWESGIPLFEHVTPNDIFAKIPAGARIVSGDTLDSRTGEVLKKKATYRCRGTKFDLFLDDETA